MIIPAEREMSVTFTRVRMVPALGSSSTSWVPVPSRLRKSRSISVVSELPM